MSISVKKVVDCRGEPTVEVNYFGSVGSAPSGTSKGRHEKKGFVFEIDKEISAFKKMIPQIKKIKIEEFEDFRKIESLLRKFGASVVIALEFAILKHKGGYKWLGGNKIPRPLGNCIGGGAHGGSLDFQEFLTIDEKAKSVSDAFFKNMKMHKSVLEEIDDVDKGFDRKKTIEGAWAPEISNIKALEIMRKVSKRLKCKIGLDIAASNFYEDGGYKYKDGRRLSREEQIDFVNELIKKNKLYYVEDGLEQEDFDGFSQIKRRKCLVVGDDLITTNPKRLKKAIDFHSINGVIIKPNQIGSIIKTKEVIDMAKKHHITPVISHRSGETSDNTISHIAVGFEIPIIKIGITGEERISKIKELIKIENNQ